MNLLEYDALLFLIWQQSITMATNFLKDVLTRVQDVANSRLKNNPINGPLGWTSIKPITTTTPAATTTTNKAPRPNVALEKIKGNNGPARRKQQSNI
jgi:hypothetical protein